MKKLLNAVRIAIFVLLCLFLVLNMYILAARLIFKQGLPKVFGFSQATVISNSMQPEFSAGDMLIFRECDDYGTSDIVIFRSGSAYVTHRIVSENGDSFTTKGDANNTADKELLSLESIEGKMVFVIPNVGRIIAFFKTPLGILVLVAAAILLLELPSLIGRLKQKRVSE